jgi:hypothetical protein
MKVVNINRKTLLCLFMTLLVCLLIPETVSGQAEKLGVVNYTPPPQGWMKTPKENVVAFSAFDQATGGFCIITLYGATPGTGNANSDFTREWNNLVVQTLKAGANPQTETQTADGWTMTAGGASVQMEGGKALAFLTVFSGSGKTVSVLGVFNEQSYAAQLDAFIGSIEFDKTSAPPPAPVSSNNTRPNSAPGRFGLMGYAAPAGWSEQKFQDGVVFKPLDLPANEHLAIQIMSPLNASGTLEQALKQSFDEAAAMYNGTKMFQADGNYSKNAARKSFNGWEYIRGKGGLNVNQTESGLELFVVKINNRFERVAILESRPSCQTYSKRYYTSDRISYRNDIENFLFSLQFADFGEPALQTGSAGGGGVAGVWQGTIQSTDATKLRLEVFSPIFLNNGQAYFGPVFPLEGLNGLNTRIPPELNRRYWGTYTFSNGTGVIQMPYGTMPMRTEGNKLVVTKNQTDWPFYRLNSVDGATFNGTYVLGEVNGKIPTITFSHDGRFTDDGALKVLYHEYIECINPATAPGSGTYEVKDYSVTFTYTDGRRIKLAFLGAEYTKGNPSPATLRMSYNEDKLTKR